jgi:CRP-like cAMP-binding protein
MTVDKLVSYFDNYLPLDDKEKEELTNRVIEKSVRRKQFILQEGDICRHYNFVVTGCLKMFGVNTNGKQYNIQFASENEWISDIGSFHAEKGSAFFIEAIEPSIVLQLEKSNLIYLYTHYPKFNRTFRVIVEDKFVELQNRFLQKSGSTAEERYLSFLDQYPQLCNRLPNTQIASYLGITPEFLSKIRRHISRK